MSKAGASKEQILQIACELFRKRGYDATTMREIAEKAKMAVGAAYYHFRSKEDMVFAYYLELESKSQSEIEEIQQSSKSATNRLKQVVAYKFRQLEIDRELVRALARVAADPSSKLSPLAPETSGLRNRAIAMMQELMNGSDLKIGKDLRTHLGSILWLYYIFMIFYWAHDQSAQQKRSKTLIDLTAPILIKLLAMSALPMTAKLNKSIASAVECALGGSEISSSA